MFWTKMIRAEVLRGKFNWKKLVKKIIFSKRTLMKLWSTSWSNNLVFLFFTNTKRTSNMSWDKDRHLECRKKTFAEKSLMETGPWIRSWMENLSCSFSHFSNPFLFLSQFLSAWINTLTYINLPSLNRWWPWQVLKKDNYTFHWKW